MTTADHIAQLEAELAEAHKQRDSVAEDRHAIEEAYLKAKARIRAITEETNAERTAHDRTRAGIEAVGELLAENGCDCACEHHTDEHDADCERCLACRIEAALFKKGGS